MVCLSKSGSVLHVALLHTGTVDQVALYPRVVVQTALRHDAHAVLLAHNHPGGVIEPSLADRRATRDVTNALDAVDIRLIDHLIFSGGEAYSMIRGGVIAAEADGDLSYMRQAQPHGAFGLQETEEREWIALDFGEADTQKEKPV